MQNKDFFDKNGNLQLELMYSHVEKFFFESVKKNQQEIQMISCDSIPTLFLFYEENILEVFEKENQLNEDLAYLLTLMFWAVFKIWANQMELSEIIVKELNQIEKYKAIQLFLNNLHNNDWNKILVKLNTNYLKMKSQFKTSY